MPVTETIGAKRPDEKVWGSDMQLIVKQGERQEEVRLDRREDGTYRVEVGERTFEIDVATAGDIVSLSVDDGRQFEVAVRRLKGREHCRYQVSSVRGVDVVEVMDPLAYMLELVRPDAGAGGAKVSAMMPGRVVEILVEEGAEVEKGQGVLVVEAMKMKNEIHAETSGRVGKLFVEAGQNVEGGDPLFEIE